MGETVVMDGRHFIWLIPMHMEEKEKEKKQEHELRMILTRSCWTIVRLLFRLELP